MNPTIIGSPTSASTASRSVRDVGRTAGGYIVSKAKTVNFRVGADGTFPYTYQWYTNDVAVPGATSATYVTPLARRT